MRSGFADGERPVEGLQQPLLVFLARGLRVALVAAHDQDLAVPQPAGAAHVEAVLGEQVGHRVGGLEAVADVGDVVDPEGAGFVARRCACAGRVAFGIAVVVAVAQVLVVAGSVTAWMRRWSAYWPNTEEMIVRTPMRASSRGSYHDTILGRCPMRSCRSGLNSTMALLPWRRHLRAYARAIAAPTR